MEDEDSQVLYVPLRGREGGRGGGVGEFPEGWGVTVSTAHSTPSMLACMHPCFICLPASQFLDTVATNCLLVNLSGRICTTKSSSCCIAQLNLSHSSVIVLS